MVESDCVASYLLKSKHSNLEFPTFSDIYSAMFYPTRPFTISGLLYACSAIVCVIHPDLLRTAIPYGSINLAHESRPSSISDLMLASIYTFNFPLFYV